MKPVRLAVLGAGMGARPHGRALEELRGRVEVAGVLTRRPESVRAFAEAHGFPVADSLDALADDPTVDAALILTPPDARLEAVTRFAAAGKHILSEKPLERSAEAAARIVGICEAAGVSLGVVFQHRFREGSRRLRGMLEEGRLGAIRMVRVEVPWWRPQGYYDEPGRGTYARDGGGVLISQAIHTLDLMLSLTGPVAEVQALTATTALHRMEAEDFATAGLIFAGGAPGALMATTAAYPGAPERIALDCEAAAVTLASGTLEIHWRDGRHERLGEAATTGAGADPMAFPADWHRDLIADFAEAIRTGRPPQVTGRDALAVQRLIAAIETSSREGRRTAVA